MKDYVGSMHLTRVVSYSTAQDHSIGRWNVAACLPGLMNPILWSYPRTVAGVDVTDARARLGGKP